VSGKPIGRSASPAGREQISPLAKGDKPSGGLLLGNLKPLSGRPSVQESAVCHGAEREEVIQIQASAHSALGCHEPRKGWLGSGGQDEADHAFVRLISRHSFSEPEQLFVDAVHTEARAIDQADRLERRR
jgi:hypothetical protein